ncbi:MAG: flagellar biosynthesis protein FlhF [Planctomycetia bacterium]|nr:flagellar biosynthesis protein FlhF [Planctomycetia bacterium]
MEVKTYRAATMQEALAMVRNDLGPTAAVLHTREVGNAGLLRWIPGMRRIEVTAALDVNVPSRFGGRKDAAAPGVPKPAHAPQPRTAQSNTAQSNTASRIDSIVDGGVAYEPTYSEPAYAPPARRAAIAPAHGPHDEVKTQISELQALVADLCRRSRGTGHQDLPETLFRLYTDLIEAEVSDEVARELVERVRRDASAGEVDDPLMVKARLSRMIEEEIAVSGPIQLDSGRRKLVALVGPTGVGKTTTIAKLAANFRLRDKKRVGLITVDTFRIAAVEQLRTYADIIDLPMHVVSTPREMRDAVNSLSSMDLVLLDTAGRSPHDDVKIQELKSFLVEAAADEVHLVLSATASASSLEKMARQFATVGTTHLLLTKLDETASLGNLLPLVRASRLPLSYLTDGQSVPDDISPADASRLSRVVLGMEPPVQSRRQLAA